MSLTFTNSWNNIFNLSQTSCANFVSIDAIFELLVFNKTIVWIYFLFFNVKCFFIKQMFCEK